MIAALNITHQLLQLQHDQSQNNQQLDKINQLLDEALEKDSQLEL